MINKCKVKEEVIQEVTITPTGGDYDEYLKEVKDVLSTGKKYLLVIDRKGNYWSNESGEFKIIHKADD